MRRENGWIYTHSPPRESIPYLRTSSHESTHVPRDGYMYAYEGISAFESGAKWEAWNLLPYRISHEVQLQSFMFKLMYRITPCRVFLHRIKVVDSDTCERCALQEDLFHFFFECQVIKEFCDSLASWLEGKRGIRPFLDDLTEEELLLGIVDREGNYSLINYIILLTKFYIYKITVFKVGEVIPGV